MATTKTKPKQNPAVRIEIGEQAYRIDLADIDGIEWRDMRRVTGMMPARLLDAAEESDFEAIGALVWIIRRRDEPDVTIEDVLREMTFANLGFGLEGADDVAADAVPPTGSADD